MLYHFIMPLKKDTVKFENHLQYSKQKVKFLCYDIFKKMPFSKSDIQSEFWRIENSGKLTEFLIMPYLQQCIWDRVSGMGRPVVPLSHDKNISLSRWKKSTT